MEYRLVGYLPPCVLVGWVLPEAHPWSCRILLICTTGSLRPSLEAVCLKFLHACEEEEELIAKGD